MRPLLGALENESISMTILGKKGPKQKSHLPEKEGGIRFFNGAKRIRTADPLHAMQGKPASRIPASESKSPVLKRVLSL